MSNQLTLPDQMTPEIEDALSRVTFQTGPIAECLRMAGRDIPRKVEAEQAHVLFWFLQMVEQHGKQWRAFVGNELERIANEIKKKDEEKLPEAVAAADSVRIKISADQRHQMRHALGLDRVKKAYRNSYYMMRHDQKGMALWDELVLAGLAIKDDPDGSARKPGVTYRVTKAGFDFVKEKGESHDGEIGL